MFKIFLFLLFIGVSANAKTVDRTAALVNADVIAQSDINNFPKTYSIRKEIDPFILFFDFAPKGATEILNYLVHEVLVLQKFPISKDEVDDEINVVQKNNHFDREHLRQLLLSQGINFNDYINVVKIQVAKRKLMDKDLRPFAVVTDEEVKNYYYTAPEFFQKTNTQNLVLSYGLMQLNLPSKELANAVYQKLLNGGDFDSLASEFASQVADKSFLGNFSEEKLSPMVKNSLIGLKVGEATRPLNTGNGYQILKITEIGAPKDSAFEKTKEQIKNLLFKRAMTAQLKLWLDREKAQSYVYIPNNN